MAQLDKIGRVATKIKNNDGITRVVYHDTTVVEFDNTTIVLRNNGYKTQTTKNRMNQASNQFNLGFYVYQKDFVWYVDFQGKTRKFFDGMKLNLFDNPMFNTMGIKRQGVLK